MTERGRFVRTLAVVVAVLGCASSAAPTPARPAPSSKEVIARARAYVDAYRRGLSALVAEERYTQRAGATTRTLVSDFAVVRADDGMLVGFRDVWEVDGRELPDRRSRAERLFGAGRLNWTSARQIIEESARFNLGARLRDFNTPIVALELLSDARRECCRVDARPAKAPGAPGHWLIEVRESERPALVRGPDGRPAFARAQFLVEAETGAVARTDLRVGKPPVTISVIFAHDHTLDLWLPESMTEAFDAEEGAASSHAQYTRWRRFQASSRILASPVPGMEPGGPL